MVVDEEEEEWEEEYVYIDLVGMVDPDKLSLCNKENTAVLGVDGADVTVLKLGGYAFAGNYEDTIGSMVFFEEKIDGDKAQLEYHCHSNKVLKAARAFLKPKFEKEKENEGGENESADENTGEK